MRKIFIILVIAFVLLASCNTSEKNIKIGFLNRSSTIERCKLEEQFIKERASQLNCKIVAKNANDDDNLQIKQAEELLNENIDILIIFPVNVYTSASIVRMAKIKGVKTINYESLIQNSDVDYFISADNKIGGELMAKYLVQLVPKGNYVIIGGDKSDLNAVLIKEGNLSVLSPYIKNHLINLIYNIYSDWTEESAYMEMKRVLKLSGTIPDAVLSSNDGMATGIINALKEFGLDGKIPVTGLDADLIACQRIAKGTQCMTIFKSFKKQAYTSVDMAVEIVKSKQPKGINASINNKYKNVPSYLITPIVVDKNNLRDVIVKDAVFTEEAVYGNLNK